MFILSLYVRILYLSRWFIQYCNTIHHFCSLFQCCQYFLNKFGLKSFYYISIHKPEGGLQSCLCIFVCLSLFTFFFCCNFTQITKQTASEPSKMIPKAISFICSPKNRLQKPVNASSQLITQTLYRSQPSILMERHLERLNWEQRTSIRAGGSN